MDDLGDMDMDDLGDMHMSGTGGTAGEGGAPSPPTDQPDGAVIELGPGALRARFAGLADPAHPLAAAVAAAPEQTLEQVSEQLAGPEGVVATYHVLATLAVCDRLDPSLLARLDAQDVLPARWPARRDPLRLDASPEGLRHWFVDLLPEVLPRRSRLPAAVAAAAPQALHAVSDRLLEPPGALSEDAPGDVPDLPLAVHQQVVDVAAAVLGVDLTDPVGPDLAGLTPQGRRPEQWLVRDDRGRWRTPPEPPDPVEDALLAPVGPVLDLDGVRFGPVHGFSRWLLLRRLLQGVGVLALVGLAVAVVVPSSRHALRDSHPVVSVLGSRYVCFDGSLPHQRPAPLRSYDLVPPATVPTEQEVARLLGVGRVAGRYADAPLEGALPADQAYVTLERSADGVQLDAVTGTRDDLTAPGLPTAQALARTRALLRALGVDLAQVTLDARDHGLGTTHWVRVDPAVDGPLGSNAFLSLGGLVRFDSTGPTELHLDLARLRPRAPVPLDSAADTWRAFEQHLDPYGLPPGQLHFGSAKLVYANVVLPDPGPDGSVVDRLAPAWEFSRPDPHSTKALPLPDLTVDVAAAPGERETTFYPR